MKKNVKSDQEKLAALLGIAAPPVDPYESKDSISREAEAAIAYHDSPSLFVRKTCGTCGGRFAHTPGAVGFCSDYCRAISLEKIGIKWSWTKPSSERWGRMEPLVVGVIGTALVDEVNHAVDHLKCPVYNHMRDTKEHGSWCWGDIPVPEGIELVPYSDDYRQERPHEPAPEPIQVPEVPAPPKAQTDSVDVLDLLAELGLS